MTILLGLKGSMMMLKLLLLSTASTYYCLYSVSAADYKVTTSEDYYCCMKIITAKGIKTYEEICIEVNLDLSKGDYDMWRLRIEQYFQVQDYALWDDIENRNSFKPAATTTTNAKGTSTTLTSGPITVHEKIQKKNDAKARSMLLMALPKEQLMTFNQYKDAKTLFAAIETRFGGNKATKKTQKTLLKQMLQKIVSQRAILGENISQEDLNLKFLRSLPSEWNSHVVVWRIKPDLDSMSFDGLYNNFKIAKQEVKGTANSILLTLNQSNGSQLVHKNLKKIYTDDLEEMDLKWQLALLSMRTRRFFQKTSRMITINGSDTAGYDKSKVECFNCHKLGYFARECRGSRNQDRRNMNQDNSRRTVNVEETSSKAMLAIDGAGFDWSYMADDVIPTNMALMAFSYFETSKSASEDISKVSESLEDKELVSNDKLEKKTVFPTVTKIEFVRLKQQEKPVRKPVKYAEMYRLTAITIKGKVWYLGIIILG
ncbi:ribonuclease H-like domain-containing protein [Tanacetum coccineum]